MAHATVQFFGPVPLGLGEGPKGQISLNLNYKVFSQMKDIEHIRRDLHSVAWVMAQGWDLGELGGQNIFFSEIQTDLMCELLT